MKSGEAKALSEWMSKREPLDQGCDVAPITDWGHDRYCEKCGKAQNAKTETTREGRSGWKCVECRWWNWLDSSGHDSTKALVKRVRGGIGVWREDETLRIRSEQAIAALTELAERVKASEKEATFWEEKYCDLLDAVGGTYPG